MKKIKNRFPARVVKKEILIITREKNKILER
mgnify:CR=1 FL=1